MSADIYAHSLLYGLAGLPLPSPTMMGIGELKGLCFYNKSLWPYSQPVIPLWACQVRPSCHRLKYCLS